jgi:vanillate O-demethylase ferredoxin subunit
MSAAAPTVVAAGRDLFLVRVARRRDEAIDICSFELVDPAGKALPPFSAGSHIDVHTPGGYVRQYSLCNGPADAGRFAIGVLRHSDSRGGSIDMHQNVREGDLLGITGPRNNFPLVPEAQKSILLAGGIGVTPMLSMAEHLSAAGADFWLHYCTRSIERTAFRSWLSAAPYAKRVSFYFDDDPGRKVDLRALLSAPDTGTHLYVCGPTGFLEFVRSAARDLEWEEGCIHFEYFSPAPVDAAGDTDFEVEISSTGRVYRIPAGQSVTTVLARNGIEIPVSCEQGVCGTCLTRVLEGIPDHRDTYQLAEEQARNNQFTPCCSRAKTARLRLDL